MDFAWSQAAPIGDAYFFGLKKNDRVGPAGAVPDGKPDAVFSLQIADRPTLVIQEISITSTPKGSWSTAARPGASYLGVASSKNPAVILNPKAGPLKIPVKDIGELLLFATDDGSFIAQDRSYTMKVVAGGRSFVLPVVKNPDGLPEQSGAAGPVKMTAVNRGISQYDAVNPDKNLGGDDVPDGLFQLTVEARDKTVTAIEIRRMDGTTSLWDTIPGSQTGALGVALTSDPIRLLNQRDGSVSIPVKERVNLNLYVADKGIVAAGTVNFRIAVTFSDGDIAWVPVQNAAGPAKPGVTKANFLATWLGFVGTDAVGKYTGLKPDNVRDTVFGLDVEIAPRTSIVGVEINAADGSGARWATTGAAPGAWGLAVAYQTAPSALLNKPDGSVNIPIEGRAQFYIYAADPGNISDTHEKYRVILHLSDGLSFEQRVRKPLASTSTVAPSGDETLKTKGVITAEFRGFIADLVNTSTRPGKDGYLDGTFILKLLQVEDKKVTKVEISGSDGKVRWSSDPKAPVMLLGVAVYPKIYKLMNEKPGHMQLPISGRKTIYLYAADNGLLSDPKAPLTATVYFSDKSSLSTEIVK